VRAAGDDDAIHPGSNRRGGSDDGCQPGGAVAVDGRAGDVVHAGFDRHVAGNVAAPVGALGEDDVVDLPRIEARATDRLGDHVLGHLEGVDAGEGASVDAADGRAGSGDDYSVGHGRNLA